MTGINQRGRYGRYIHYIFTAVDFLIINLAFVTVWHFPTLLHTQGGRTAWLLVNLVYLPVAYWMSTTHKIRSIQMDHVAANSLRAVVSHAVLFIASLYIIGIDFYWTLFAEFYCICFVALPLWWLLSRIILKTYRRRGKNFSRVVIVGTNTTARRLQDEFRSENGFGYKFMGFFDDECSGYVDPDLYRGDLSRLEDYVKEAQIDEIFYALSGENEEALQRVIRIADDNMARFYYVPRLTRFITRGFTLTALGPMPVLASKANPLKRRANRVIKRTFDIVVSSVALIMSPLVLIPVGIAIKISSPGPVFFRQKRTGYRGRDFECLKFRTMKVNAAADTAQATKNDPRKTRLGNILRHTSIDELPQFWNVFKGDMSVIGPRPHMLRHTEQYSRLIDQYMMRHTVKPGITGWAQVNGYRGETRELWQMEKRVEFDMWYIEHWSLLLDMKIMFRTVYNAIVGEKNAF